MNRKLDFYPILFYKKDITRHIKINNLDTLPRFIYGPQGAVWGENLMYGSIIAMRTVMLLPTMII